MLSTKFGSRHECLLLLPHCSCTDMVLLAMETGFSGPCDLFIALDRAGVTPFLAAHLRGYNNFKWMLYGDDDTVFFIDNALDMLEGLDHNMPYFLTDHLWFPDQYGENCPATHTSSMHWAPVWWHCTCRLHCLAGFGTCCGHISNTPQLMFDFIETL